MVHGSIYNNANIKKNSNPTVHTYQLVSLKVHVQTSQTSYSHQAAQLSLLRLKLIPQHSQPIRNRQPACEKRRLQILHRGLLRHPPNLPILIVPIPQNPLDNHILHTILLLGFGYLPLAVLRRFDDRLPASDADDDLSDS